MKPFQHPIHQLPPELDNAILKLSEEKWTAPFSAKKTADNILQLSDFYIQNPEGKTPWEDKGTILAYLFYYLPLNFLRSFAVFHQLNVLNLLNSEVLARLSEKAPIEVDELGSGFGSCSLAFFLENPEAIKHISRVTYFEVSDVPSRWHQNLFNEVFKDRPELIELHGKKAAFAKKFPGEKSERNTTANPIKILFASYALTEIPNHEKLVKNYDLIIILEPSTSTDGRKLMQLRQTLIEQGQTMLAPCLHQQACPLLTLSPKDWCHDRIHWTMPKWFLELEKHLPIKNQTLTFSYLVSAKAGLFNHPKLTATTANTAAVESPAWIRTVGDILEEKGKNRQLICYDQERRFFAWMHKDFDKGQLPEIPRGSIVPFPENYQIKSNELRVSEKS